MTRFKTRIAYQVVIDEGAITRSVGWRGRLFGKRRAARIVKFLCGRGLDARMRCIGRITMPQNPRLFD